MALANPITWQSLCAEFGLNPATAVFPTSFYGKGGAPASGALGFQDFVGRSGGNTFTPPPGTYTYQDNGYSGDAVSGASVTVSASTAQTWSYTKGGANPGAVTASLVSGGSGTSITFELPPAAGLINRTATVTLTVGANTWNITLMATGLGSGGGHGTA